MAEFLGDHVAEAIAGAQLRKWDPGEARRKRLEAQRQLASGGRAASGGSKTPKRDPGERMQAGRRRKREAQAAREGREYARDQGGKFAPTNTSQSRARDAAVRGANARGDNEGVRAAQSKYEEQWHKFLESLPKGGKSVKEVAGIVRAARMMDDDELEKAARETDDPDLKAIYEALIENRKRTREQQQKEHPLPGKKRPKNDGNVISRG